MARVPTFQAGANAGRAPGARRQRTFSENNVGRASRVVPIPQNIASGAFRANANVGASLSRLGEAVGGLALQITKNREYKQVQTANNAAANLELSMKRQQIELMRKPSENMIDGFLDMFGEQAREAREGVQGDKALERFDRLVEVTQAQMINPLLVEQARWQGSQMIAQLEDRFATAQDIVAESNDPQDLLKQQLLLREELGKAVDDGVLSDPKRIQKLGRQIDLLSADYVEHILGENPELAAEVLEASENIPIERRTQLERRIQQAARSQDQLLAFEMQKVAQDAVAQMRQHGSLSDRFDLDHYAELHGEARAAEINLQLETAQAEFSARSRLRGASPEEIDALVAQLRPQENEENFAIKERVWQSSARYGEEQKRLLEQDPFAYTLQDPVVAEIYQRVQDNPNDTAAQVTLIEASLGNQARLGVPESARKVLPQALARGLAAQINGQNPSTVVGVIGTLSDQFGSYYPQVFQQLATLSGEHGIRGEYQLIALHHGAPWLQEFVEALNTEPTKLSLDSAQKQEFKDALFNNRTLDEFRNALVQSNPAALDFVDSVELAVEQYAQARFTRSLAKNPTQAVRETAERVIGSLYAFERVNGSQIAIPRTFEREDGTRLAYKPQDYRDIRRGLGILAKAETRLSPELYPRLEIAIEDVTETFDRDVLDQAFYATRPDNQGVALYAKNAFGDLVPLSRPDGSPIEFDWGEAIGAAQSKPPAARPFDQISATESINRRFGSQILEGGEDAFLGSR